MSFRVLTFNTWHGLNGSGVVNFGEFEGESRRQIRRQGLIEQIKGAHLICLQEVNPLESSVEQFESCLRMRAYAQRDQSGLKAFGFGIPFNLNTGLLTLVDDSNSSGNSFLSRDLGSIKLSGGPGYIIRNFSAQLSEFRFAQLVEIEGTPLGRILVVNWHLHHGFEWTPELDRVLVEALRSGLISQAEYGLVVPVFQEASERRLKEVQALFKFASYLRRDDVDGILICGDLNCPPGGLAYQELLRAGFTSLTQECGFTWNPAECLDNHSIVEGGFRYPYPMFDRPEQMQEIYRRYDRQPRVIDYIFWKSLRGNPVPPVDARLIGTTPIRGIHLSDHFGLQVDFK